MGYNIDLEKISLAKYKKMLKSGDLIPSRQLLKEDLPERFDKIKKQQIANAAELVKAIKTKEKVQAFSKESGIDLKYLTVLSCELRGYIRKPNRLKDFPGIPKTVVLKMEKLGIKNTLHLFDEVQTKAKRKSLAKRTGIKEDLIFWLTKLTDLSRVKWVNHTFAYVLSEAGYDTVKKLAKSDYKQLYKDITELNAKRKIYPAHIGEHDMKLVIEYAKLVALEIEY